MNVNGNRNGRGENEAEAESKKTERHAVGTGSNGAARRNARKAGGRETVRNLGGIGDRETVPNAGEPGDRGIVRNAKKPGDRGIVRNAKKPGDRGIVHNSGETGNRETVRNLSGIEDRETTDRIGAGSGEARHTASGTGSREAAYNAEGARSRGAQANRASALIPEEALLRLERSSLWAKGRIRGTMQGKRRSKQLGSSLDFADYRLYTPGDDIRQLDWNAYGRTGKPFIKLYMDEQELQVSLFVDGSASMSFAAASKGINKFLYAKQLAGCIGYSALCGYDRVGIGMFSDRLYARLPMLRGKAAANRLFHFLLETEAREQGDITTLCHPSSLPRRAGMSWVFSDFLYEAGVEQALASLLAAQQEVVVVQVLSPEELNPELSGDLRLIDVESGEGKEVAISGKIIQQYKAAVQRYTEKLRKYCYERGIVYQLATTDSPLSNVITETFKRSGVLQ